MRFRPSRTLLAVSRACAHPTRPRATGIQPITARRCDSAHLPTKVRDSSHERTTWQFVRPTPSSHVPENTPLAPFSRHLALATDPKQPMAT
eukprot:4252563-Prymnesium_polylepis.2